MNIITIKDGEAVTMSSVELVEVINDLREKGKAELRHDNFMTKVEKVLGSDSPKFLGQYKDTTGRTLKCYYLPKREASLMVMSESYAVQAKVYDRMTALETKPVIDPMQVLSDPTAMRGLLLSYSERLIAVEAENDAMKPKVNAFDRLATADGSFCIRDAAKNLQLQEGSLKKLLVEKHWIYRRPMGAGWLAYSDKLQHGLMEHKVTTGNKADGSEWISTQPRITGKGMIRLSSLLSEKREAL